MSDVSKVAALVLAAKIADDIRSRQGIGNELEAIEQDEQTFSDMRWSWAVIIDTALSAYSAERDAAYARGYAAGAAAENAACAVAVCKYCAQGNPVRLHVDGQPSSHYFTNKAGRGSYAPCRAAAIRSRAAPGTAAT